MKHRRIVSIVLILNLLLAAVLITWAWIEGTVKPSVTGDNLTISVAPGILIELNGAQTDAVNLNDFLAASDELVLAEASSVDGEKLFFRQAAVFPTDGTVVDEAYLSQVFLRDATSSDKNKNYIDINFKLKADGAARDIYFDPDETFIKRSEGNDLVNSELPIRVYLCAKNSNTGEVIQKNIFSADGRPAAENTIAAKAYNQITFVLEDDPEYLGDVTLSSFSDFSGVKWLQLSEGQTADVFLKVWLEGCDEHCTDIISGNKIDFSIKFTTEAESGGESN